MADLQKIVDDLSSLTVLEAAELAKLLEEKWGVSAAAAVAVAGPAAAAADTRAPACADTLRSARRHTLNKGTSMALKVFNDLAELGIPEVEALLKLARRLQTKPEPQALAGKVLALLFLSPSLRTLSSFQAAMIRLGGGSFVISTT